MYCSKCGKEISNEVKFCPYCGEAQKIFETAESSDNIESNKRSPKKDTDKKTKILILSCIAVLCAVLVISVGAFTQWFGLNKSPIEKILTAAYNTVNSEYMSFNYTDSFDFLGDISATNAEIKMHIDIESKSVNFLAKDKASYYDEYNDEIYKKDYIFALKDGRVASIYSNDGEDYIGRGFANIQKKIDTAFGIYEHITTSEFETIDWKYVLYDLAESFNNEDFFDDIDFSRFNECVNNIMKDASNQKWLKENLNYTFEKSDGEEIYRFQTFDGFGLLSLAPYFKDVTMSEYSYESFEDFLCELVGTIEIRVKDNKITYFNISGEFDDEEVIIELKDFDYSSNEESYEEIDSYYDEMVYLIEDDKD